MSTGKAAGDYHLHHHAGGDLRLYLNPVFVRVFGMIDTQDGEDGSRCIPQTVLYKPTTYQGYKYYVITNIDESLVILPGQTRLLESVNS